VTDGCVEGVEVIRVLRELGNDYLPRFGHFRRQDAIFSPRLPNTITQVRIERLGEHLLSLTNDPSLRYFEDWTDRRTDKASRNNRLIKDAGVFLPFSGSKV